MVLVHCSAGVGRTGTFIALYRLLAMIEAGHVTDTLDVFNEVFLLRADRCLMVQLMEFYTRFYLRNIFTKLFFPYTSVKIGHQIVVFRLIRTLWRFFPPVLISSHYYSPSGGGALPYQGECYLGLFQSTLCAPL